jgi:hypothetical protein
MSLAASSGRDVSVGEALRLSSSQRTKGVEWLRGPSADLFSFFLRFVSSPYYLSHRYARSVPTSSEY